jgi:hypothetical protein
MVTKDFCFKANCKLVFAIDFYDIRATPLCLMDFIVFYEDEWATPLSFFRAIAVEQ